MRWVFNQMHDMRGNFVAGIAVAVIGAVIVRTLKPASAKATRRLWVPVVALISGPVLTFAWCLVDLCCIAPGTYTQPGDFTATAVPVVIIGVFAGTFGAAVFWLAER
jgi:hypothetical protein